MKDAATGAGLSVLRIINEPSAVAIGYDSKKSCERNIIVYSLGVETLDVSLLNVDDGVFEVVATSIDYGLGGAVIDRRIASELAQRLKQRHGPGILLTKQMLRRLWEEAEKVKVALSSSIVAHIEVDIADGKNLSETFTRAELEELGKDLLGPERVLAPVERVLEDSGIPKRSIDEILLFGGTAQMPVVQRLLREFFGGKELSLVSNPEAASYGAAKMAGVLKDGADDILHLDVTPLTIGMKGADGMMIPLIKRNTVIPTKKSFIASTWHDNQPAVVLEVFEGEHSVAADNHFLKKIVIGGLPPAPRGHPQIEVTLEIDSDGILHHGAQDLHTGKSEKTTPTSEGGVRLSEEEMEAMISETERFAFQHHPDRERIFAKTALDEYLDTWLTAIDTDTGDLRDSSSDEKRIRILDVIRDARAWSDAHPEANASQFRAKSAEVGALCDPMFSMYTGAVVGGGGPEAEKELLASSEDNIESWDESGGNRLAEMLFTSMHAEL
eukprot:gnl/TRDRNA2_/TRDRNA2_146180_c1_seq1.p1 gnl/TRDRNA2_/TRDRNA2_146180_c1~~gnl/TRDRNA2_/TRDRNA2_146180_c1_seq1.p1  ORF type:complete len:514 (+),score=111.99 gnl/TRDRNA2_/TRDRNA2_146180_c1_seq1:49-1542(+)